MKLLKVAFFCVSGLLLAPSLLAPRSDQIVVTVTPPQIPRLNPEPINPLTAWGNSTNSTWVAESSTVEELARRGAYDVASRVPPRITFVNGYGIKFHMEGVPYWQGDADAKPLWVAWNGWAKARWEGDHWSIIMSEDMTSGGGHAAFGVFSDVALERLVVTIYGGGNKPLAFRKLKEAR